MRRVGARYSFIMNLRLSAVLLALCGVAAASAAEAPAPRLRVVASFYPMYLHTLNVVRGVPGVELKRLAPPTAGCLHDYQPSPQDLATLSRANVLVANGAGMESFLDKARRQAPGLQVIDASRGLELKTDGHGHPNAHLWLSLAGAIRQVDTIAAGLAALDPEHAAAYRTNALAYTEKLSALRDRMRRELAAVKHRSFVAFHEAFPYFAEEFDLEVAAVIRTEPGADPGPADLARIIRTVRAANVRALMTEPQYSPRAAEAIARETGARLYVLDPIVSGPDDPGAYLQLMEKNLETLKRALGAGPETADAP